MKPPHPNLTGDRRLLAAALAVAILTLAVFLPVLHGEFVSLDDPAYVTRNTHVRSGLGWPGVAWAFTSLGYASNWHPLTWLSHMLDVQLFGLDPAGHHATSLLLHVANAVLLLWVLRRLTGALWPSTCVAALFAVHPLHVESVAWVAERKDVLSSFFWIATTGAYLRLVRRPGLARHVAVLVLFALGLLAKPMLVTLPFVLLLLDYWPLGRWGAPRRPSGSDPGVRSVGAPAGVLAEKIPLLLLAAASGALTLAAQHGGGFAQSPDAHYALRAADAVLAYVRYAAKAVWPVGLAVYYPLKTPVAWQAAVAGVGLAALSAVAIRRAATAPFFVVGWFWFLGTLVPVIGMTQRGAQAMADRYTYMPLTGLFIAAAWGCSRSGWAGRARPVAALAAAALLACALLARSQVGYWHDSVRLLSHATSLSASFSAHKALGGALYDRGRLQEAEAEFRRSLALDPGSWEAHARLGDALYEQRRLAEAAAEYEAALQGAPLNQELHTNLANVRDDLRQTDQALGHYQEALRIDPGFVPALINLGLLYQRRGLLAEAVVNYRKALAVDPLSAEATKRLGAALEAVRASRPPARRDPDPVAQP